MIALALLASTAWAVTVTFCVEAESNFYDVGTGEDYWTTNDDHAARGVWLSVIDNVTSSELFTAHYTNDGISQPGCHAVSGMLAARTYTVSTRTEGQVNNVTFVVNDQYLDEGTTTFYTDYQPPLGNETVTMTLPSSDPRNHLLQVAGYAIFRASPTAIGIGGPTIEYRVSDSANSYFGGVVSIYSYASKWVIAHETGHAIGAIKDENSGPLINPDAPVNNCDGCPDCEAGHSEISKEFQSTAAVEGWADFFSASVWNDAGDSDCVYDRHYSSNWDLNDDITEDPNGSHSCEDIPVGGLPAYVSANDWLEDLVVADDDDDDGLQCGGTLTNRGTQFDWLRFFWDMRTDQAVSFATLAEVWDDMNPKNWDEDGSTGTTADDPIYLLDAACTTESIAAKCTAEEDNGQDH